MLSYSPANRDDTPWTDYPGKTVVHCFVGFPLAQLNCSKPSHMRIVVLEVTITGEIP